MSNRNYTCAALATQRPKNQKLTQSEFIERANIKHDNKYDYSETVFVNTATKVRINCPKHGSFEQLADNHLRGVGCPKCGAERRADTTRNTAEKFIERARKVHGDKYTYDKVIYISNRHDVVITCPIHGDFNQRVSNHIHGKGCYHCTKRSVGWSKSDFVELCKAKSGKAILYVLLCMSKEEKFYKIGITSDDVSTRYRYKKGFPYKYTEMFLVQDNPSDIYDLETELHQALKEYRYEPKIEFKGYTECFTTIEPIKDLLTKLEAA